MRTTPFPSGAGSRQRRGELHRQRYTNAPGGGAKTFNYPFDQKGTGGIPFDAMDLEIVDGELSGSIQMGAAFGEAVSCDLTMQGTDGNWSGQWQCFFGFSEELFAFTAIPFRVEPGHEHDKVSER